MQGDISSTQREVRSITTRVEQCQMDIQQCLKHHHPNEDWFFVLFCFVIFYSFWDSYFYWIIVILFKLWVLFILYLPLSSWDFKGEYLWFFLYSILPFVILRQKGGVFFCFWTEFVFLTGQVIFVPELPKGEFVNLWLAAFCLTKSLVFNAAT
jgi:hypothetical protein